MNIFIDKECKCHTTNPDGAFREFEVPFFNDKCKSFIEGHRYCPKGESYTREDGEVFCGECVIPWENSAELYSAQRAYEKQQIAEYESALSEIETALGVST